MTSVRSHDQGFVGATPTEVYRALADVRSYPTWWRGAARDNGAGVRLGLDGRGGSVPVAERHREDVGLFLRLGAPYPGVLEWYLEPFEDGTIVNCLVEVEVPGSRRGAERRLRRLRATVRRGLVGLKEALE